MALGARYRLVERIANDGVAAAQCRCARRTQPWVTGLSASAINAARAGPSSIAREAPISCIASCTRGSLGLPEEAGARRGRIAGENPAPGGGGTARLCRQPQDAAGRIARRLVHGFQIRFRFGKETVIRGEGNQHHHRPRRPFRSRRWTRRAGQHRSDGGQDEGFGEVCPQQNGDYP